MGTTVQKLQRILETKTGFKNLITEKGGVITETTTFHEYIDEARKLMEGGKVVVEEASATAVPNEGYVEEIYFNTNLTSEEVDKIITEANLDWFEGTAQTPGSPSMNIYFVSNLTSPEYPSSLPILIMDYASMQPIPDGSAAYAIMVAGEVPVYISPSITEDSTGWIQEGFNLLERNGIVIHGEANSTCNLGGVTNNMDAPVGLQNEALKQIISTTPFAAGKQPVPNSGYVDTIKFNTSLSPEEVNKIITEANLDFSAGGWYYPVIIDSDNYETATNLVAILSGEKSGLGSGYAVVHNEYFIYASTSDFSCLGATFVGWNPDFNGEQTINTEAIGEVNGHPINAQNDKLVDLVYIGSEPFKAELTGTYEAVTTDITENGEVDLTTYWDSGEMPIKVNVNVEGSGDSGVPLQPATEEEMNNLLVNENIGKVFLYIGETNETYTNGQYYIIEEV